MAARSRTRRVDGQMFMLALGLLVGFIIGFVLLLSRLPVDSGLGESGIGSFDKLSLSNMDFEYYAHLPEQKAARKVLAASVGAPAAVTARELAAENQPVQPADSSTVDIVSSAAESPTAIQRNQSAQNQNSPAGQATYFLQAGNYRRADQAERARATVMMLGLDAFIVVRQDANGSFGHRVRIGPFIEQTRLLEARDRLRSDGIPYQMIRVRS